jgi:uncharacterized protein
MTAIDLLLAGLAAVAAGAVNALAGGGTLITFPTLTALGIPTVAANVTNTVALCPGYLGGTLAQAGDLAGQRGRIRLLVPAGVLGGAAGAFLVIASGERVFRALVPWLILLASVLLALQDRIRGWLARRAERAGTPRSDGAREAAVALPVGVAAVYGGYFGAGLSVILLAVLGVSVDDSLTRLNAVKQAIAFAVNVAAAVVFVCVGHVVWPAAVVMAVGALAGGAMGGRLAGRVRAATLRRVVVTLGVVVATIYLVR